MFTCCGCTLYTESFSKFSRKGEAELICTMFAFSLFKDSFILKKLGFQASGKSPHKRDKSNISLTSTADEHMRDADVISGRGDSYANKEGYDRLYRGGVYFDRLGRENRDDRDLRGDGYCELGREKAMPMARFERHGDRCVSCTHTSFSRDSVSISATDIAKGRKCSRDNLNITVQVSGADKGTTNVHSVSRNATCQHNTPAVATVDPVSSTSDHDNCESVMDTGEIHYQFTLTSPTSEGSVTSDSGVTLPPTRPKSLPLHLHPGDVTSGGAHPSPSSGSPSPDVFFDAPEIIYQWKKPSPSQTPGSEVFQDIQEDQCTFNGIKEEVEENVNSLTTDQEDSERHVFVGLTQDSGDRSEPDVQAGQNYEYRHEKDFVQTPKVDQWHKIGLKSAQEKVGPNSDIIASRVEVQGQGTSFTLPAEGKSPAESCYISVIQETEAQNSTNTQQENSEDDQFVVNIETDGDSRNLLLSTIFSSEQTDCTDQIVKSEHLENIQSQLIVHYEDENSESNKSSPKTDPVNITHGKRSDKSVENQDLQIAAGFSEADVRDAEGRCDSSEDLNTVNKTSDKESNKCCQKLFDLEKRNDYPAVESVYLGKICKSDQLCKGTKGLVTSEVVTEETEALSLSNNFEKQNTDKERLNVTAISSVKCEENERTDELTGNFVHMQVRSNIDVSVSSSTVLCKETEGNHFIKNGQLANIEEINILPSPGEKINSLSYCDQCYIVSESAKLSENSVGQGTQNGNNNLEINLSPPHLISIRTGPAQSHDTQFVGTQQTHNSPDRGGACVLEKEWLPARCFSGTAAPLSDMDTATAASHGELTCDQLNTDVATFNSLADHEIIRPGNKTLHGQDVELQDQEQSESHYTHHSHTSPTSIIPNRRKDSLSSELFHPPSDLYHTNDNQSFSSCVSPQVHHQRIRLSPAPSFGSSADCHSRSKSISQSPSLKVETKLGCQQKSAIVHLQRKFLSQSEQEEQMQHHQQEATLLSESLLREETRRIVQLLGNDKTCKVPRPSLGLQDRLQSLMLCSATKKNRYTKGPRFCSSVVKNIVKHKFERPEVRRDTFQVLGQIKTESSLDSFPCNHDGGLNVSSKTAHSTMSMAGTNVIRVTSNNNMNVKDTSLSAVHQDDAKLPHNVVNTTASVGTNMQNTAVSSSEIVSNDSSSIITPVSYDRTTQNKAENHICTSVNKDSEKHSNFKRNTTTECTRETTAIAHCAILESELSVETKDKFDTRLVAKQKWKSNAVSTVNMSEGLSSHFSRPCADWTGERRDTLGIGSPDTFNNHFSESHNCPHSDHVFELGLNDKMERPSSSFHTNISPSVSQDNKADISTNFVVTNLSYKKKVPDITEDPCRNSDTATHSLTHPAESGTVDEVLVPETPEILPASNKMLNCSQPFPQPPRETTCGIVDLQAHITSLNKVSLNLVSKVSTAKQYETSNRGMTESEDTALSPLSKETSVSELQTIAQETEGNTPCNIHNELLKKSENTVTEDESIDHSKGNFGHQENTAASGVCERQTPLTGVIEVRTSLSSVDSFTDQSEFCQESIVKLKTDNLVNRWRGAKPQLLPVSVTAHQVKSQISSVFVPPESTKPQQATLFSERTQHKENTSHVSSHHTPGCNVTTKSRQGSINTSRQNSIESWPPLPPYSQQESIGSNNYTYQRKYPRSSSGACYETFSALQAFQQDVKQSRTGSHHVKSRRGSKDPSFHSDSRRCSRGNSVVRQPNQLDNRRGSLRLQSCSRRGSRVNFSEDLLRKCLEVAVEKCDSIQWEETASLEHTSLTEGFQSQEELDKSLKKAVYCHDAEQVRTLVKAGANPNVMCGRSAALLRAAKDGALYVVQALLAAGADADVRSDQGNSPLHVAARGGYTEIVIQLVHSGAYVDAVNRSGVTPVQMALAYGQQEVARALVRLSADLFFPNKVGETAYDLASELGYTGICSLPRELRRESAPGTRIEQLSTEIPVAVKMIQGIEDGCPVTVEECLAARASPNTVVPLALHWPARATVLHRAAHHGHDLIVRLLLLAGGDVNKQDFVGNTPLHAAVQAGHNRVVKLLLGHGASLEATSQSGMTPLHRAAAKGKELTCNLLLRRGANAQATDRSGYTPGDWARKRGFKNLASKLVYRRRSTASLLAESKGYQQQLQKLHQLHQAALEAAEQEVCGDCEE